MPQMYPLNWMLMMRIWIFVLLIYLILVYYLVGYFKYDMKLSGLVKTKHFWEW